MKVTAYDFGKCGLTNLFYAGTIKFDTTAATAGAADIYLFATGVPES